MRRTVRDYVAALPGAYERAKAAPGAAAAAAAATPPVNVTATEGGGASAKTDYVSPPTALEDNPLNQLLALMLAAQKPKQPVALY